MFHVPEVMRVTTGPMASVPNAGQFGMFAVRSGDPGWWLVCIADDGNAPDEAQETDWEHVSVTSRKAGTDLTRLPNWGEMCAIKAIFWDDEDAVVQFHPRKSEYIDCHPNVLHLWRYKLAEFPTPPRHLV